MTSKLQVTVPKRFAEQLGIEPGDEIEWSLSGDSLRIRRESGTGEEDLSSRRLRAFDQATARQRRRQQKKGRRAAASGRGWTREELYQRGSSR